MHSKERHMYMYMDNNCKKQTMKIFTKSTTHIYLYNYSSNCNTLHTKH